MSGIVDSELSDWELEALQKAEAKFMRQRGESGPFSVLPLIADEEIRGTWFSAYDNTEGDERVAEAYRHRPLLIYSEKNRFPYLCDQFMNNWVEALDEFIDSILRLERDSADMGAQMAAKSFGIDVADDCYIVSFPTRNDAPIFATRELLFRFVKFAAACLEKLGEKAGTGYDPATVNALIREWEAVVTAAEESAENNS